MAGQASAGDIAAGPAVPTLFIVGAPRSGTSVVYRALALHPEAVWISNYVRRLPVLPEAAAMNRLAARMPRSRSRVWFGEEGDNAYRYGGARSLGERLFPQPVEGEPLFARRHVPEEGPTAAATARQLRLASDLRRLRRAAGGSVVISKRIGHNRRIPLLHGILPEARFLVVTRDGRAVARSLARVDWWPDSTVWWYGGTPRDWAAEGRDPIRLCAEHWVREVEVIEAGLEVVPQAQVMRVRYEELVAEPTEVLSALGRFAGLPPSAAWDKDLAGLRFPDKNRAARQEDDEGRVIREVQEGALLRWGYQA